MMAATKKHKLCGLEPELEDKLDQIFGGVVATDKCVCAPNETEFCGTRENMTFNLSCDSPDLHSPELPEIMTPKRSKRPRVKGRKKGGTAYLRNQILPVVGTFNDAPHIVQATSIKQVVQIMDEDEEISKDFELYFFAVELLQDSVHRDFFAMIAKEKRVAYLRHFYARKGT